MYYSSANPLRKVLAALTLLSFSSSILTIHASPTRPHEPFGLVERVPNEDPYPNNAGIEAAYVPGQQPSVFFSNIGDTNQAERDRPDTFAGTVGGRTFRTAFTPGFTDRRSGSGGRTAYADFAKRFSAVFAEQATGTAYVLLRDDPNGPHVNSVWTLYERPALENGNKVNEIVKVDPSTFAQTILWTRPGAKVKAKRDVPDKRAFVLDWDAPADGPYWLAPGQ
ncbi:hypothetical protein F4820DRAFT_407363 [Hypoxylon rubiginosum]|uniref:Uncharacterized protein n=1 Tax=Hypoxylon rubiginosum TaxID=110542 RepID=A0ACB9ZCP0_9PEZI|nr:hypothetical protein F4820DRAFT_407363 [Hypoxylon rubiginosum]